MVPEYFAPQNTLLNKLTCKKNQLKCISNKSASVLINPKNSLSYIENFKNNTQNPPIFLICQPAIRPRPLAVGGCTTKLLYVVTVATKHIQWNFTTQLI